MRVLSFQKRGQLTIPALCVRLAKLGSQSSKEITRHSARYGKRSTVVRDDKLDDTSAPTPYVNEMEAWEDRATG